MDDYMEEEHKEKVRTKFEELLKKVEYKNNSTASIPEELVLLYVAALNEKAHTRECEYLQPVSGTAELRLYKSQIKTEVI